MEPIWARSCKDAVSDLLRVMYDAQLKKMLAYIASAISSFAAQLSVFLLVVGRSLTLPTFPAVTLTVLLWLAQVYFAVAIVTKYHELMILENELGITRVHHSIYSTRPLFAKLSLICFSNSE